jgi:hypothetical protein
MFLNNLFLNNLQEEWLLKTGQKVFSSSGIDALIRLSEDKQD